MGIFEPFRGTFEALSWEGTPLRGMRDILEALAAGELSPREAEARLRGYVEGDAGRYDAGRWQRRGIPEAIVGEGKTPEEAAELAELALETTDYVLITRADDATRTAAKRRLEATDLEANVQVDARGELVTARVGQNPSINGTVAIVTGGTADATPAREAAAVVRAVGGTTTLIEDVGVAALNRVLDEVERINEADVIIAAAGREGSLPTVLAGLTPRPVIALPTSNGYGTGGEGEAALKGALQSCTVLTTVNVDAGYVAGAQAALILQLLED